MYVWSLLGLRHVTEELHLPVQARISHVKKYADVFRSIYPNSTIVVVQMESSWLTSAQSKRVSHCFVPLAPSPPPNSFTTTVFREMQCF